MRSPNYYQWFLERLQRQSGGWLVKEYPHPEPGPDGGPLATTVFYHGPQENGRPTADKIFVVSSGTHGLEGPAGALCQLDLMRNVERLRFNHSSLGVLIVYALNPFGFSWKRRVDHQNADVNRTAGRHDLPNTGYDTMRHTMVPEQWGWRDKLRFWCLILPCLVFSSLRRQVQAAVTGGQYSDQSGLFYGGEQESWSVVTLHQISDDFLTKAKQVAWLDIHTGLGKKGVGTLISCATKQSQTLIERLKMLFGGEIQFPLCQGGDNVSAPIAGDVLTYLTNLLGEDRFTAVALEYGTAKLHVVLYRMVAENWAWHHGRQRPDDPIREDLQEAFLPQWGEDLKWRDAVMAQYWQRRDQLLTMLK